MNYPVGFANENQPKKIQSLMRALNYDIQVERLSKQKYQLKKAKFQHLPIYPEKGFTILKSDTLFVKIGR